ncbi:DUF5723 family protein [Polaribacter glomeratus]|uniref:DUF5723 domain-containing protein n=1 Tax=Polaribacter glomeratus TaxID=102 RepID=A0A2S7WYI3_9FLAO|nr:DUF5723 family protein [Polaribacter glomeratus]PQJ82576.1 hypothetical protein BTO16_08310 [Polaribacter glomeratus]TXD64968.1 hypothetical protein ESX12_12560 [Polaribacter glomeratus]
MKRILCIILILSAVKISAQNKQVLYDFAELPQTLLLNPGAETNYKFHFGVPLMSGFSLDFGSSEFILTDLFALDNRDIDEKISSTINSLTTKDFLSFNSQIEILNGGFRLDDKTYISSGFYEEIDAISYYPKDLFILLSEGNNPHLNKSFNASQLLYKLDVLGVLHAGVSRKMNDQLTVGGRFKIYSSALNIESTNNTGTFTTVLGRDNIYRHYLSNVDVSLNTSGLIKDGEYIEDPNTYLKNTFLGGNLGFGVDFGLTYHINEQLEFSGSILDVGFINHSKNIKNTTAKGSFVFDGIEFEYDADNPTNYWGQIDENFKEQLPTDENEESYISWRPAKLNAALKYSFGERRSKICYDNTYKDFYTDAIGVQLYSIFRPLNPQLALTGFYQKAITQKIQTKVTYTIDDFSYANIGAGLSAQFGKVNLYGMLDNILEYSNLAAANSVSLQMGINVIFN